MSKKAEMGEVEIIETAKCEIERPILIFGFAGMGLVGGIAISHVIDQLELGEIAHLRSACIPPAVVFFEGTLKHAFRIYSNKEGVLCAAVCEIPLLSRGIPFIASKLLDWAEQKQVKEIIVLDGVPVRGTLKKRTTFCISEPKRLKDCEGKGIPSAHAGIIQGIAGSILDECLSREITGVAFLVPTALLPDPEGAAILIDALNSVYNLNIRTEPLLKQAEEIKRNLKEVAKRHRKIRVAEERTEGTGETYIV